jgi:hypothetical protein
MAKLHELQLQIDQGKTATLRYQDKDGDNIKVFISQGQKPMPSRIVCKEVESF